MGNFAEKIKKRLFTILRSTEPYTKTDMVYFFRGNFWLNANRALGIVNGLALSVAFAHLMSKEAYGLYSFALAFIGLFSMPQTTALGAGILKGVSREDNSIIEEGLRRIFPWSLAGSAGLIISALYYFIMGNDILATVFLLASLVLPISVSNGVAKSFFTLKGDFGKLARFNIIRTPILTIVLIISAWLTHSAFVILVCSILGNVILGAFLYVSMRRTSDFTRPSIDKRERFASRYAFHAAILSLVTYLSEKIDSILLWKFLGGEPVAIYTYASTPVREIRTLIENQGSLAIPKYAKKEFAEVKMSTNLKIRQMYIVAVPLVILYVFAAPYIFTFLFPQYLIAVPFSQLIALSILASPRRLMNAAISSHQKIRESYIMIILPSVTRIIFAVILIPLYGITGAIMAFLFSEIIDYIVLGTLMGQISKSGTILNITT